jgi:hypothetical protein
VIVPYGKKIGVALFVAGLVILLAFAALWILNPAVDSTVRIKNISGHKITGGELEVCRQRFAVPATEPDGTASFTFKASFDSAYRLRVDLQSGHTVTGEVGYVTRGLGFDDELLIHDSRVELGTRAVQTPR